jgi:hypothetical protein
MTPPSRFEIEQFANEKYQADVERRLTEYARKQAQALAQARSRGNVGGYLPALIECKQEALRAEIFAFAHALVEAGTIYAAPLPVWAEETLERRAAEMAGATGSALRGELELRAKRIRSPQSNTGAVNRAIESAMKSAVRKGRLRLKTQRIQAERSLGNAPASGLESGTKPPAPSSMGGGSIQAIVTGAMSDDFWRNLKTSFFQLRREWPLISPHRLYWTAGLSDKMEDPDGINSPGALVAIRMAPTEWMLTHHEGQIAPAGYTRRFEWLAEHAAARLGFIGTGRAAVSFWVQRIASEVPEALKPVSKGSDQAHLPDVCYWSAHYCDRCSALEASRPSSPSRVDEMTARAAANASDNSGADERSATMTSAELRQAFVRPILERKGWSILDWANDSTVDFHTASDYWKGTTKPYRSTRKKLADSLGVDATDLPA